MIVHVHVMHEHLCEVTTCTTKPIAWWRRLFLRQKPDTVDETRFVTRGVCGHWHFDDSGKLVADDHVLEAVTVAIAAHRAFRPIREALAAHRRDTQPPN